MGRDVRISDFGDHRTPALLEQARAIVQEVADQVLEQEWGRRVGENVRRRNAAKVDAIANEILASGYLSAV